MIIIDTKHSSDNPSQRQAPVKKVSAIDIGSKTVKLVIGEYVDGCVHSRLIEKETLNLGEEILVNNGAIGKQKLAALGNVLVRFMEVGNTIAVTAVLGLATSAVRNAKNMSDVANLALDLGIQLEVADGIREGVIGYLAATGGEKNKIVGELGSASCQLAWWIDAEIESRSSETGYESAYRRFISQADNFSEAQARYQEYLIGQFGEVPDNCPIEYISLASKSMTAFVTGCSKSAAGGRRLTKTELDNKVRQLRQLNKEKFFFLKSTLQKVSKILPGMIFMGHVMERSRCDTVLIEEVELPVGLIVEYFAESGIQ